MIRYRQFIISFIVIAFTLLIFRFLGWRAIMFLGIMALIAYVVLALAGKPAVGANGKFENRFESILSQLVSSSDKIVRSILIGSIAVVLLWGAGAYFGSVYFDKENSKREGEEIISALTNYHAENGNYPANLNQIISNNPMRRGWAEDEWNTPYSYNLKNDGKDFSLISAGKDKVFKTEDDLILKP